MVYSFTEPELEKKMATDLAVWTKSKSLRAQSRMLAIVADIPKVEKLLGISDSRLRTYRIKFSVQGTTCFLDYAPQGDHFRPVPCLRAWTGKGDPLPEEVRLGISDWFRHADHRVDHGSNGEMHYWLGVTSDLLLGEE